MTALTPNSARNFILDNTALMAPPHVPEILLHLADEAHDLWQRTEDQLAEIGLPPPFWAFAWAGGQGLARYILDNPSAVHGKRVLDFASGSGLVAIAAVKAGAAEVIAADIDPFCATAIRLNAGANDVAIQFLGSDCIGTDAGWDVVLAGDVFYDNSFADRLKPWFATLKAGAAEVIAADIDPFCATATRLNAESNGVGIKFLGSDCIGTDAGWDVVLAGDVFYDNSFADRLKPWFATLKARGADILVGDPGRSYLPKAGLEPLAVYEVAVTRALEDALVKLTTVWRFA